MHSSETTTECLENKRLKVLQSPDLNMTEMQWWDLKSFIILKELKQCCKQEWGKIAPQKCERPIKSHRKQLLLMLIEVVLQVLNDWVHLVFYMTVSKPNCKANTTTK